MDYKGSLNGLRTSPRKVALIVDLVRGKKVEDALAVLSVTDKRAAGPVAKLINSVVANYKNINSVNTADLMIKEIFVTEGVTYKRGRPVSRGRIHRIMKRSSKINITLQSVR